MSCIRNFRQSKLNGILCRLVHEFVGDFKTIFMNVPAKSNKMSVGDSLKLEALREEWKYERERNISLELELIGKEMENRELQNENEDLREQLQNERLDWVSFASVVTNLLWKASDSPKVAEPVLKGKPNSCSFPQSVVSGETIGNAHSMGVQYWKGFLTFYRKFLDFF